MTQLEFDFNSSTEDVLKAFKYHETQFLLMSASSKDIMINSDTTDLVIRDFLDSQLKEMDFHFEQYEKARDILDSREVY